MRRRAWGLVQGKRSRWEVRAFFFADDVDTVVIGAKTLTRLFARSLLSITQLATHARTADQRGVLVAVDYDREPAKFKIRGRKVIPRNVVAKQLVTSSGPLRMTRWTRPARIELRDDWLFLHSFYTVPKWLGHYVNAATAICDGLAASEAIQPRKESSLPPAPPL
jgi:hypothetical protein